MLAYERMNENAYTQLGLRKFPRRLARDVKKAAAERGITLTEFMVEAASNQLRQPRHSSVSAELKRDFAWFQRRRHALEKKYPAGTTLAIVGEKVVDSDADVWKLSARLRGRYGHRSIFMPRIGERLPSVIHVRSPHIVR